jgi:hypothetical protein
MYAISKQIGQVVAADTRSSASSLDLALVAQARMCATVIEASEASHLPMGATQKVMESLTGGMRSLVESRAGLLAAVQELTVIQGRSNLRETAFGCPTGPYVQIFTKGSSESVQEADLEKST